MKRVFVFVALLFGCDGASDPIEVKQDILVTVKPIDKPGIWVDCHLDGKWCTCTMSECSQAALTAAGNECNRLRNPIVIE